MATPRERASGLLHGGLGLRGPWPTRSDPDELEGSLGALECVGLLSLEDAEVWRAELARATGQPRVVDAGSLERAAGVLSELLDAVGHAESEQQVVERANRFQGALQALAEIGAVDRAPWEARLRKRWPLAREEEEEAEEDEAEGDEGCPAYRGAGTEQELLGVIAGSSELLDGWRVLYGLRFKDAISFVLWRDPGAGPGPRDWDAHDALIGFHLRDSVGTKYGGADDWGAEDGAHGVSFAIPSPEGATWVELVNVAGQAVRLAL